MKTSEVCSIAIAPALSLLAEQSGRAALDTTAARVMLLAIGLQESRFEHRRQVRGPARGFWQFEVGGGVNGVLHHVASKIMAASLCEALSYEPEAAGIYTALADNDVLAAGFARLLLWTDARPLPRIGDYDGAWEYYLRNWWPGKPRPETWVGFYGQAMRDLGVED